MPENFLSDIQKKIIIFFREALKPLSDFLSLFEKVFNVFVPWKIKLGGQKVLFTNLIFCLPTKKLFDLFSSQ